MVTHSSVYMNRFNRIFGFKRGIENNAIEALRGFYLRSSVSQGGMYVFVEFQCGVTDVIGFGQVLVGVGVKRPFRITFHSVTQGSAFRDSRGLSHPLLPRGKFNPADYRKGSIFSIT